MRADPGFRGDPASQVETHVRMRASLRPVDVVFALQGTVHSLQPGQPSQHLFDLNGFSITRAVEGRDGWDLLSRHCLLFCRTGTDELVDHHINQLTGETNEVMHVWNDPVVEHLRSGDVAPPRVMGSQVHISEERAFLEPSPLPPRRWPRESAGELHQGVDLLRFVAPMVALDSADPCVPCAVSVSRFGPWLPWMAMDGCAGHLVHHLGGVKLGGYQELPTDLRAHVQLHRPEFAFAPTSAAGPSATTWTVYPTLRRPLPPH